MISAAWFTVVKRPFASRVTIASEADSTRWRSRLGAGECVLRAFGIGDVSQCRDRPDELTVHPERPARYRHIAFFACVMIDDPGFVALRFSGEDLVLARGNVGSFWRRHVIRNRLAHHVVHLPPEQPRTGLVRRKQPPASAGHPPGVRNRRDDVGRRLEQVQSRGGGRALAGRGTGAASRRNTTSLSHA